MDEIKLSNPLVYRYPCGANKFIFNIEFNKVPEPGVFVFLNTKHFSPTPKFLSPSGEATDLDGC